MQKGFLDHSILQCSQPKLTKQLWSLAHCWSLTLKHWKRPVTFWYDPSLSPCPIKARELRLQQASSSQHCSNMISLLFHSTSQVFKVLSRTGGPHLGLTILWGRQGKESLSPFNRWTHIHAQSFYMACPTQSVLESGPESQLFQCPFATQSIPERSRYKAGPCQMTKT